MSAESIKLVFSTAQDGRTKDLRYRQRQFRLLHEWIKDHIPEIETAVRKDDGLSETEARFLITVTLNKLRDLYDALDLKKELTSEYCVKNGQDNPARRVPEELTYVIPEIRTLFFNVMSILYACIAASSCCMVELPKDLTANTSLLLRVFREALDRSAYVIVNNRPPTDILSRCLVVDQTGSISSSGLQRLISSETNAAAVVIVDRTANLDLAAQEVLKSRVAFSGRGRYSPSYVLVNEFVEGKFLELLQKYTALESSSSMNGTAFSDVAHYAQTASERRSRVTADKIVLESRCFRFIKLSNRTDLWESHQVLKAQSIMLLATSSHDDAIDALNATNKEALLALYVFADLPAAKYLTQFVRTRVSFVNHIPTNMLAWPAAPIGYPVSPDSLYSRAMIESTSPQFVHPTKVGLSLGDLSEEGSQFWKKRYLSSLQPLRPMGQPKEGSANFFSRALLAGVVFYVFPVLAVATGGSVVLIGRLWRWIV